MEEFPLTVAEVFSLGTSLAISGMFFYSYRKKRKIVGQLKDAPQLALDQNLINILNVTPGKCLQYVIIEGAAQPVGEPLRSQFKDSIGVLQKLIVKEHTLVWNGLARAWLDNERVLQERVNVVPFSLVGSEQAAVRVLCPLEASSLKMEMTHEKFQQARFSFGDILNQYLIGEKPKGQLETEEMFKVGATLTAVGELILDTDRVMKLRPPSNGSQYFLTTLDPQALRMEQETEASKWWMLASIFALAGLGVLLWAGGRRYRGLQARWAQERQRREFETMGNGAQPEEELPAESTCVICLSQPRTCVLLDCGHVCCCFSCYQALPRPLCPICRQVIRRVVPFYQA